MGAVIEGTDSALFQISDVDTGVIQPGDTAFVTVRAISQFPAIKQIVVRIESTSYRDAYSTLFVMLTTSVDLDRSTKLSMFVYPNPFSSKISIIVPKELVGETISIYNSVGSLIYRLDSVPNQSVVWDPASVGDFSLSRGAYLAFVTNGKSSAMNLIYYLGQ